MDAIFAIDRAKDFDTFRAAARNFEVPSQNLIYADTEGHIGYQSPGKIPQRAKGDGTLPAPGWDSSYQWKGYIPFEKLPYEYDPERGYIVTANQAVIDPKGYSDLLTKDWGYGSRSQRINDLIESKTKDGGKISPDDMRTMQTDNRSEIATLLNPLLLKIDIADPYVREAQKLLEGWDYTQEPDSAAAAYFNAVWRNVSSSPSATSCPRRCAPRATASTCARPTPPARSTSRTSSSASAASATPTRRSRTAATAGTRSSARSSSRRRASGGPPRHPHRPGHRDP